MYPLQVLALTAASMAVGLLLTGCADDGSSATPSPDATTDTGTIGVDTDSDADDGAPDDAFTGDTADAPEPDAQTPADTAPGADTGVAPDATPLEPTGTPTLGAPLGGERPAKVWLPEDYSDAQTWPLVVLLHGFSANGTVQDFYLGTSKWATALGYVLVVPEGTKNSQGNQFWNATDACCNFEGIEVDDVAYLASLIEEAQATYAIDPARVFLFGHSNGGFMSYRMACERPELIAGIASLAGATWKVEANCPGGSPVTVLQIHGTADDVILYGGTLGYPSALQTAQSWAERGGCGDTPAASGPFDFEQTVEGAETEVLAWSECDSGAGVALWTLNDASHIPIVTDAFMPAVMDFFLSHVPTGK
jgi:polyhydroxybutyrate depolymerase